MSLTCKKQRYLNKRYYQLEPYSNFNGPFCEKHLVSVTKKVKKKKKIRSRSNDFSSDEYSYLILYSDPRISEYSDTRSSPSRDGSSWVEPVLSLDKCVLLKDTTQ